MQGKELAEEEIKETTPDKSNQQKNDPLTSSPRIQLVPSYQCVAIHLSDSSWYGRSDRPLQNCGTADRSTPTLPSSGSSSREAAS